MCSSLVACADNGPRFLLVNLLSVTLHILFGILIAVFEIYSWAIYFIVFIIGSAVANLLCMNAKWRNSRRCGDTLGIMALLNFGHFLSSLPLQSRVYTKGVNTLLTSLPTVFFLCLGLLMAILTLWHKKIVCPAVSDTDVDQTSSQRNIIARNVVRTKGQKFFVYSLGPIATIVFGFAESRFGSGVVPVKHSLESIIGIVTAGLMYAFYRKRYRQSAWCSLISLLWVVVTMAMFVAACVLYGVKANSPEDHMQHGISLIVCLLYAVGFCTTFSFKFCLLKEHLHLNFSRPPVDSSKLQETTIPNNPYPTSELDVEAQPYGMTRSEAAAAARKLGYADMDRGMTELSLATEPSETRL